MAAGVFYLLVGLAGGAVVVRDRREDDRRKPVAVAVGGGATDRDGGAVGHEGADRLALVGRDQRTHLGRLVERVADLDEARHGLQHLQILIVDGTFDQQSGAVDAALSVGADRAGKAALGCVG